LNSVELLLLAVQTKDLQGLETFSGTLHRVALFRSDVSEKVLPPSSGGYRVNKIPHLYYRGNNCGNINVRTIEDGLSTISETSGRNVLKDVKLQKTSVFDTAVKASEIFAFILNHNFDINS
jgi:hypothetical protein